MPRNTAIKNQLAQAIVKSKRKDLYPKAIQDLEYVATNDRSNAGVYRLMAEYYSDLGIMDRSNLSMAQYYIRINQPDKARRSINLAKQTASDPQVLTLIEDASIEIQKMRKKK